MRNITKIEPSLPILIQRKRVAAYARVSTISEKMEHSLSQQISYYNDLIQRNPEWQFVGVYSDDGISGTGTERRAEFNRMMEDANAGRIDIILCKSISRWARNTVDLLKTIRKLKDLGIEVRFEKENINSLSSDGELMLSILASFAQEESRSISENLKWSIRKRFENGIATSRKRVLGYRWEGDRMVVVPEEAVIVRRIFQNFLEGKSRLETAYELNAEGIGTINGCRFVDRNIRFILTNITYTGNLILQKRFITDPITRKDKVNKGELPMYFIEGTHEPIIDKETFDYVQSEMAKRRELGTLANKKLNITCFTRKIRCPYCGYNYIRTKERKVVYWRCGIKKKKGGHCKVNGYLQESAMKIQLNKVLGTDEFDEELFKEKVDHIEVPDYMEIDIFMKDGTVEHRKCTSTAREDSWTKERRIQASMIRRNKVLIKPGVTCFTTKIKCGKCGCNYRRQTQRNSVIAGGMITYRCQTSGCKGNPNFRDDVLRCMTAEVMGIQEFDETLFLQTIVMIRVSGNDLTYFFKDGRIISKEWVKPKRIRPKHTEEFKQFMSEYMKNEWKRRSKEWQRK